MLPDVTVTCFLLSYLIALLLELGRLAIRFPGRNLLLIGMLALGWLAHTIFLCNQLYAAFPQLLSSWFEWVIFAAWGLAAAYLALLIRNPQSAVGVFLTPIILGLIGLASLLKSQPHFDPETTVGLWRIIHGVSLLIGTTFVLFGAAFGVMYLVQSFRLKSKGRTKIRIVLPPLEFLQSMNRLSLFASVFGLAIGMISGVAINLSEEGKIAWLSGGIVFTFVLFLWSLVAAITELASQSSLGGRRTAYLALANFVFMLVVLGIVLFSSHGQPKRVAQAALPSMQMAEGTA
jgi:ABC-type transport system involved in cytochrome c biogenesis permease subunit